MRYAAAVIAVGLLLAVTGTAGATRIDLGTATGGLMIYYNNLDNSGAGGGPDGVISGYDENPANQAYMQGQYSASSTDGMAFQFDPTDLGGFNWNDIFSGQPVGSSQFGLDLIVAAPTYDPSGGVSLPDVNFVDNVDNSLANAVYTDAFPESPMAWAINDYKWSPPGTGGAPLNSLLRGTAMTMTGTVTPPGTGETIWTLDVDGTLVSDGLIHWYNPALGSTALSSWYLGDTLYYSGTLYYDQAGDVGAGQRDFYAGDLTLQVEAIPEPFTMAGLVLGIGSLVGYVRKRRA